MSLADLATYLKAQQEAHPNNQSLWGVFDIDLVAVGDTDRINDREWEYAWFDTDECDLIEYWEDMFDALETVAQGDDEVTVNGTKYERLTMMHVPRLITVFLSRSAALRFIDGGLHEFRAASVKSISLKRNAEMQEVRQLIANTF